MTVELRTALGTAGGLILAAMPATSPDRICVRPTSKPDTPRAREDGTVGGRPADLAA
jgi:hypothetical protein